MDKLPDVLGSKRIDQQRGRLLVQPTEDADGFWFGGGNCVRDSRDAGDSRTGLSAGTRGRELALFRSTDDGRSFNKIRSWDKIRPLLRLDRAEH